MVGRTYNNGSYRYGFNGKENDNEVKGEGNSIDFGDRVHDPRLGRFLSLDRLSNKFPGESNYSYAGNNPILQVDVDGQFKIPIHFRIFKEAFQAAKLSSGILERFKADLFIGGTVTADLSGAFKDYHFDGRKNFSQIKDTWSGLNKEINNRINDIGAINKSLGGYDVKQLGINLHTVQDFYSHSNYVELYVEYFKGANGKMPTDVPTYEEGLKVPGFKALMDRTTYDANGKYQGLHTGEFNLTDNEFWDINPFGDKHTGPNSHKRTNKDEAKTPEGKLAKKVATKHTTQILKKLNE